MPDAPVKDAASTPLGYAAAPVGARARVVRWVRPGTVGFVVLLALLAGGAAWGGWKGMLYHDRKAFEACASFGPFGEAHFTHPPSRGALRHLARLPGEPWALCLEWPAAEASGAATGIGAVKAVLIFVDRGVDADALLVELARPDYGTKTLQALVLSRTSVTDAGLAALARPDSALKGLGELHLEGTHMTDRGLAALAGPDTGLTGLTELHVDGTHVTDAGVAALARPDSGLKTLSSLYLSARKGSEAGIKALRQARPTLVIHYTFRRPGVDFPDETRRPPE